MSETAKKFDPDRELAETALDAHLRTVALRNGRAAALFLAAFTTVLWPTDLLVFRHLPRTQEVIGWTRLFIIGILLAVALAMRTRLGPRRPVLLLSTGGTLILLVIGWCLGALGGAGAPWIYLALPALFFTVLAPVRLPARIALVTVLAIALCAGFLAPHPEHLDDPMVRVVLSFTASLVAMVVAVGHLSFRILRQSFYQSLALERASRALGELAPALEAQGGATARELIDQLGPATALEWLARRSERRTGVRCRLEVALLDALPTQLGQAVFGIFEDSLINVARHAGAREARLRLRADRHQLLLEITDDGLGVTPALGASGFGLIPIRERVRSLDGHLEIAARPGSGTTLTIHLPLSFQPRARS
ncbi:MAG TPA: ATP-binding protein [Polyangia bacterium]